MVWHYAIFCAPSPCVTQGALGPALSTDAHGTWLGSEAARNAWTAASFGGIGVAPPPVQHVGFRHSARPQPFVNCTKNARVRACTRAISSLTATAPPRSDGVGAVDDDADSDGAAEDAGVSVGVGAGAAVGANAGRIASTAGGVGAHQTNPSTVSATVQPRPANTV